MSIVFLTDGRDECVETRAVQLARSACVICLMAGLVLLAGSMVRAADAPLARSLEQVDRALLVTYFHGITEEIALSEVGVAGVPRILEHLADPGYPRRDNLVAFLEYLAGPDAREALLDAFTNPELSMAIPEEDRARLMIPHALGKLASRGDEDSLELLMSISTGGSAVDFLNQAAEGYADTARARVDLMENVLRGLAFSGADRARDRLVDVGLGWHDGIPPGRDLSVPALDLVELMDEFRSAASGSAAPAVAGGEGPGADPLGQSHHVEFEARDVVDVHAGTGDEASVGTLDFDTQSWTHENHLTYANHLAVTNKMDNDRLDEVFLQANRRAGATNYGGDVACCAMVKRSGNAVFFGLTGDGLDSLDSSSEAGTIIGHSSARVKVIRAINWCGGSGSNIIGCAFTPGNGMALVRMTSLNSEAILWIHEYGHNTGLGHAGDVRRIMYGTDTGGNNGLIQTECNRYHSPSSAANASVSNIGACEDSDGDSLHDVLDNCPDDMNFPQTDSDLDGFGNTCDNCSSDYNPDQTNTDGDTEGDLCDDDDDNDRVSDEEDCAPLNPLASQPPGEPSSFGWTGASAMSWQNGVSAIYTNVYRGEIDLGSGSGWDCLAGPLFGSAFVDADEPDVGEGFRYVLTGTNVCGESTAGSGSEGTERQVDPCP